MTEESKYLLKLAQHIAQAYIERPGIQAVMVTGSVAEGLSDRYSDIDMMTYYDALPSEEALIEARHRNGGADRKWMIGNREEGSFAEAYDVNGVECQIGHNTSEGWEISMAEVLENHDIESPLQKALTGMLICQPLYGEEVINRWKHKLEAYPPALGKAMVTHYLKFFPLWGMQDWIKNRDATIWRYEIMVESAQHLLGVLAGLNQQYFATFQFKRMHQFAGKLKIAPDNLAKRLEAIFSNDRQTSIEALEQLVADTMALVEQHMPEADTSVIKRKPGWRHKGWTPM
jgi:hypothetical protein